jgi:EmrB/QacA subfamily drug resistance transporter
VKNNSSSPPVASFSLSRRQVFWTLAGVALAMLLSALDQTVVGTAMPRVVADLGGFNQYTWVTSVYMITSAVSIPIVGKLSDMYGRKIFYIIGITIFVLFSLACGLSQNMMQLIIFRGAQGVGGGILMTSAFTVIADLFPPVERGKYQGILAVVFSFASVIGPTVGGFLTDNISWHWVFFINVPLGILVVAIFLKFFPDIRLASQKRIIDYGGLCALILTVVPAMLALSWGGVEYTWGSPQIIGLLVFAGVMFGLFILLEYHAREPILPLALFKDRIVAIANLVTFITGMGMFGAFVFIPLYLQGVLGASATASGNMQIPQSIAVMFTAFIAGRLMSRSGGRYRALGILSMVLIFTGIFLLSRLTTGSSYWMVILDTIIIGFGMGFSLPVFTSAIQNSVPYAMLGVATSTNTFMRSFGGAVGLAILGSIMNNRFLSSFMGQIPETVKNSISMEKLHTLAQNPQALVSPDAQMQLKEIFISAGSGTDVFDQVMNALRQALSSAISEAFLVASGVLIIGLVATFFLREGAAKKDDRPVELNAEHIPEK